MKINKRLANCYNIIPKQLYYCLLLLLSTGISAQIMDNAPYTLKKYVKNQENVLSTQSASYSKNVAIKENRELINKYYSIKNRKINGLESYAGTLKIYTDGFAAVVKKLPYASPFVAMGKTYLYQEMDKRIDIKKNYVNQDFENKVKTAFTNSVKMSLSNDGTVSFNKALANFETNVKNFQSNLKTEDYQIIASNVDLISLDLIKKNREQLKNEFETLKNNITEEIELTTTALQNQFNQSLQNIAKQAKENDVKLLKEIHANADKLKDLNAKIEEKYTALKKDVSRLKKNVETNSKKIEENTKYIKQNQTDIAGIKVKQAQNRKLISENRYSIDVLTDVMYQNVNIAGKQKLLDLKFKNDPTNPKYLEEKQTLSNIQSVEDIQYALSIGSGVVELATNLGMSAEDAKKANEAIAIGNVIANGAMAYFTGDPMSALNAVNGAFALFNGGNEPDPQFDAIMGQFAIVNQKLDNINQNIITVHQEILDLKSITIDFHVTNQKRFNQIDAKLDKIQTDIRNIEQVIYAETASLNQVNLAQYEPIWTRVENATSRKRLRIIVNNSPKLENIIKLVYKNTEDKTINNKTFLHYNAFDDTNHWENEIYKPIIALTKRKYSNFDYNAIETTPVYFTDIHDFLRLPSFEKNNILIPRENFTDIDRLIYPQSIITLSRFTGHLEPYFYFFKDDFTTLLDMDVLDTEIRNENLRVQFQNLLYDNRKAIIQTNLISGITLLSHLKKHITEKNFNLAEKNQVFEILTSQNEHLKMNLSNYIINSDIIQKDNLAELQQIMTAGDYEIAVSKTTSFNAQFANQFYQLAVVGTANDYAIMIEILPQNVTAVAASAQTIYLPLPTFDFIFQDKLIYPSYLQTLIENQEFLINKILKYDIVEKMNKENLQELKIIN